jgi:3-oxoacyl-[acyl-carrier-protein] synthase III
MKVRWAVEIAGTGIAVPAQVVTNADFEKRLDTSNEWIVQRTGIHERRIAAPDEATLTFSTAASRMALQNANLTPTDIDLIVQATVTPDHTLPSTACELQAALGCRWIPAFDLSAACSGYIYALVDAAQYIASGMAKNVLLLGSETLTRITDMEDRGTAVLFGDGAGAAILRPSSDPERGIISAKIGADGARAQAVWIPGGGSLHPSSHQTVDERAHYMKMNGRAIYKFAVTMMHQLVAETLEEQGITIDDLAYLIPHQSNLRIIESATEKLGIPMDRVAVNIDRFGNTSAASIAMAVHEAFSTGRVKRGDLVMLVAFGAGLTWGCVLMRI